MVTDFWVDFRRYLHWGYSLSKPWVKIAKARNICRGCRRSILKSEKYLRILLIDPDKHRVGNRFLGFNRDLKFCKECAVDLLKICSHVHENEERVFPYPKYKQKLLVTIHSLFYSRNRFNILTERNAFFDFLKSKGVILNTICPKCNGQGRVWQQPRECTTVPCDFPGCDNGHLNYGVIDELPTI
jgi:hypothetical protein